MIYVKVVKRQGGEELHTADRTEINADGDRLLIWSFEQPPYEIDILSGDAVYCMTQTGETMSAYRPPRADAKRPISHPRS